MPIFLVGRAAFPDPRLSKGSKDREAVGVRHVADGLTGDMGGGDNLIGCDVRVSYWLGFTLEDDCVLFGTHSSSRSKGVARLILERDFDTAEGREGLTKATPKSPVLVA
jgi:hypothetical protein